MCYSFELLAGLLTPVIGITTVIIAYQQWRTNQRSQETNAKRLKHELYEKRYAIYLAALSFLREIMVQGNVTDKMLLDYYTDTNASGFLLKKEITDYLQEINDRAVDLQTRMTEEEYGTQGYTQGAQERSEMKKWFYHQIGVLRGKFHPYLSIEE